MDHRSDCLICDRIAQIQRDVNSYFVAELETGYVVMGDFQFFNGYTLFLCKQHTDELHKLDEPTKLKYLKEMSEVAEAVYKTFKPHKLNYELLGNGEAHLHWHLFPRYPTDPVRGPVWLVDKSIRYAEEARPSTEDLVALKDSLLNELMHTVDITSIKSTFKKN